MSFLPDLDPTYPNCPQVIPLAKKISSNFGRRVIQIIFRIALTPHFKQYLSY